MTHTPVAAETTPASPRFRRGVFRATASALLITLGAVLAPVALVATASQSIVRDTNTFVDAFAPLAENPAVQEVVVDQVAVAIDDAIDTRAMVRGLISGAQGLDMPAAVSDRLTLLEAPAVAGINSLIRGVVINFVESPAFADTWRGSLRLMHTGMNAAIEGTDGQVLVMHGDTVAIDLAPVIAAVRTQLIDRGVTIAQVIPDGVGGEIMIAEVQGLTQVRLLVELLDLVSVWLPLIAAAFVLGGVWVAVHSRRAAFGAGIALFFSGLVPSVGLAAGRVFAMAAGAEVMPRDATAALFDAASAQFMGGFVALTLVGALTALGAWWTGPRRSAVAARATVLRVFERLRLPGALQDLGEFVRERTALLGWALTLAGAAALIIIRPFTPQLVIIVAAVVLLVAVVGAVFSAVAVTRHTSDAEVTEEPTVTTP